MVTAKRAKWSPASSKKKNSTQSNRKLLWHSSAIPAPSKPSPTSSSTANPDFECESKAFAFTHSTPPPNPTTNACHPERIRQGCTKDLNLKYFHPNLAAQLPLLEPTRKILH